MKKLILLIATVCVIGCANPEFERYARTRQAEIAYMPNGKAKQQAQGELDADRKVTNNAGKIKVRTPLLSSAAHSCSASQAC